MERQSGERAARDVLPRDPALLRHLVSDVRFAPLWLPPRLLLGWFSLAAGWGAMRGMAHPASQMALPAGELHGPMAAGLTLAGIALLLGALTGSAAFVAGCLSSGLWAGEALALAPLHFAAVVWLVLTWKTAGWIGLDRWLLPLLGLPWQGGLLFGRVRPQAAQGSHDAPLERQ